MKVFFQILLDITCKVLALKRLKTPVFASLIFSNSFCCCTFSFWCVSSILTLADGLFPPEPLI